MEQNQPKKSYYPPMHTCEHVLNQTMVRMFACDRSKNTHIERKKSKCDYLLPEEPTPEQIEELACRVNEVIQQHLPVTIEYLQKEVAADMLDISKLPEDVSETLRIVRVGDYDACPCIGEHVENTSEIGIFQIVSHNYTDGCWRLRFKLV
jgi:Ser-tRNA(Ala) deacylase AlaX